MIQLLNGWIESRAVSVQFQSNGGRLVFNIEPDEANETREGDGQ